MATATATRSLKLTDAQQAACIKLFQKDGVTNYREISAKLKLEYVAVNKFMTKWKKKVGILKTRGEEKKAKAKKAATSTKRGKTEEIPMISNSTNEVQLSELLFLRKFYLRAIAKDNQANG